MPDTSPRLDLPYLMPSQAQKHVTHNSALEQLDTLVQLVVEDFDVTDPPATPAPGDVHALGSGAQGLWAGQDGQLARWSGSDWQFIAPRTGWRAWGRADSSLRAWTGTTWAALNGAATENLDGVGINTTSDSTNRLAVSAPATLLSHEGAGHQLKINKATAGDTASLLYQTGWSGRAEIGLTGTDDLAIKTSADGTAWTTALTVAAATGYVGIGTDNPVRALDVDSDARITGDLAVAGAVQIGQSRIARFKGGAVGGLVSGSDFGTLIDAPANGHMVLGIRENNSSDSVTIVSGSGDYSADTIYDRVVATFHSNGRVGIGEPNPQRSLHVSDVARLEPSSTPSNPQAGDIYFDAASSKLRCHDGTVWQDLF